ncbi:MAG: glycosyltransferase family 4 protein [Gammaproteobacteria bacterium]|nr:glycosyltransferase family 4 protein [Gammaproteobacteria bacterium]
MKILLVTNIFPPAIGGPATFGARLADALSAKGYRVTVFCATPASGHADGGYPFRVVRAGLRGNRLRREMELRARLLKSMVSSDMVYCMGLGHQTHWAARATRRGYTLRVGGDSVWELARNTGATSLELEEFYRQTDDPGRKTVEIEERKRLAQVRDARAVIYVSEYLRSLAGAWTRHRPVSEHIVPNGIDITDAGAIQRRRSGEALKLVFVGRQTNWKGVDSVLLALAGTPGATLTVLGSGPVWPANVDLCRRLGLADRVTFRRSVDSREVLSVMFNHHVLVLPSLYEGLSNTLLEAGTAGLACIVSNRGGNPEVVEHDTNGLLIDPFDVDDLRTAIARLRDDEDTRSRLAESHRRRVQTDFNLAGSVEKTARILQDVAAAG